MMLCISLGQNTVILCISFLLILCCICLCLYQGEEGWGAGGEGTLVLLVSLFLVNSTLAIDVQEHIVDEAFFHSLCIYWFQKKWISLLHSQRKYYFSRKLLLSKWWNCVLVKVNLIGHLCHCYLKFGWGKVF